MQMVDHFWMQINIHKPNSGTSGGKTDNLEITGGDSSKITTKTKRKKVKTLRSADGENEEDFLTRLSSEIYGLSQDTSVEHCANICTSGDQFSAEIYTDGSPLQCGVATKSCSSSNEKPLGKAIHAHVRRFKITRELRKMYPSLWNSRQRRGTADVKDFSRNDNDFVKGGTGLYLATPDGYEYLPPANKE